MRGPVDRGGRVDCWGRVDWGDELIVRGRVDWEGTRLLKRPTEAGQADICNICIRHQFLDAQASRSLTPVSPSVTSTYYFRISILTASLSPPKASR